MFKECPEEKTGIFYFPPRFVYHSIVESHNTIKKTLLPEIEKNLADNADKHIEAINRWPSSKVLSSFHFKDNEFLFNHEELVSSIWDAYNQCVFYLQEDGWVHPHAKDQYSASYISDIWYNKYEPGGNQEIHNHVPHDFSGVYYLEDSEIANTTWYNCNNIFPGGNFDHINCNSKLVGDNTSMSKVTEGYIVIFPAGLSHYVPEVKSSKITISFNIDLE